MKSVQPQRSYYYEALRRLRLYNFYYLGIFRGRSSKYKYSRELIEIVAYYLIAKHAFGSKKINVRAGGT